MRKIFYAIALASSAVALNGCNLVTDAGSVISTPPLAKTSTDEKALYVAEVAFKGVSQAIEQGVDQGLIKGQTATTIQGYYGQAKTALDIARQAQKAGDSGKLLDNAVKAQELVTKIFGLIRK